MRSITGSLLIFYTPTQTNGNLSKSRGAATQDCCAAQFGSTRSLSNKQCGVLSISCAQLGLKRSRIPLPNPNTHCSRHWMNWLGALSPDVRPGAISAGVVAKQSRHSHDQLPNVPPAGHCALATPRSTAASSEPACQKDSPDHAHSRRKSKNRPAFLYPPLLP